jgi:hypothetical protein
MASDHDTGNQDLKTLLPFRSGRERIELVPRGLRNSQPPKQWRVRSEDPPAVYRPGGEQRASGC